MREKHRFAGIIITLILIISSIVGVTYAWQSANQQAKNELIGEAKLFDVELIKLEKTTDGEITQIPIEGAVFYLFREDGTQINGRFVTDKDGKIPVRLPKGSYYFEEYDPGYEHTFDKEDGIKKTRYPFTIIDDDSETEVIVVRAYNVPVEGSLTISKIVEYEDGSYIDDYLKNMTFGFTVTFSDGGSYPYRIDGGEEQILSSGEKLYLKHGQLAVFENIPVGVSYKVTEDVSNYYWTSSSGHQGNITADGCIASFLNHFEKKYGSLRVTKEIKGELLDKQFEFVIELNGVEKRFVLKPGEYKDFLNLPLGTKYKVTEIVKTEDGYIPTTESYVGVVTNETMIYLPFLNIQDQDLEDTVGTLEIKKEVYGEPVDLDREFKFEITFEGDDTLESPQYFTLKANETKVFENIPSGVRYTIREIDSNGYLATNEEIHGVVVGNEVITVCFVNSVPEHLDEVGKLRIKKVVEGDIPAEDLNREFEITLVIDGVETTFTLRADEIKEFEIPNGAYYEVTEKDYYEDGYIQTIVNGSGVAHGDQTVDVLITNKYIGESMTEIDGEKTWDLKGYNDVLPESIKIQLMQGDRVIEEQIVKADNEGNWKYHFEVPKYDVEGNEIEYTVHEIPMDEFYVEYDGFNIKNTYIEPIVITPPAIEKRISGDNAPDQRFEFVLEGSKGSPMPEGAEDGEKRVSIYGNGKVEIGEMTFDKAGEYTYTLKELKQHKAGWTYDDTVYELKVSVTEENGKLVATQTLTKNGEKTDIAVFSNIYKDNNEKIYIDGIKTWENDNVNIRPKEIIVQLYADGELTYQKKVTAEDEWCYGFEVDRYAADGHEIKYSIAEVKVDHYNTTVEGYNLINTYEDTSSSSTNDSSSNGFDGDGNSDSYNSNNASTGDNSDTLMTLYTMLMFTSGILLILISKKRQLEKRIDSRKNKF